MTYRKSGRFRTFLKYFFFVFALIFVIPALIVFFLSSGIHPSLFGGTSADGPAVLSSSGFTSDDFRESELSVCFFSIGQADSILIKQGNNTMLIDCGDPEDAQKILKEMKTLEIDSLSVLVLTHPHSDHIGGAESIINSFDIDKIYLPDVEYDTYAFDRMLDAIIKKDIDTSAVYAGMDIPFGDAAVSVLSPCKNTVYENINQYSAVLLLEYDGVKMLFCGDAEYENEDMILSSGYDIDCALVKVAHHGSRSSSSYRFVEAADADWAIITSELYSDDELPKDEIIDRWEDSGACVLCTAYTGNIYAAVNNGIISVYTTQLCDVNYWTKTLS